MEMTYVVVAFVCCTAGLLIGSLLNTSKVMQLQETIEELMKILNGMEQTQEPKWGDWFIDWQGIERQLPDECPEDYDMTPEDYIRINSLPPWEKNKRKA